MRASLAIVAQAPLVAAHGQYLRADRKILNVPAASGWCTPA